MATKEFNREYESVVITNPTSEDFTRRWNGEPYEIKANETKGFAKFIAFHLAKHLSTKMLDGDFPKKKKFLNEQERNTEALKYSNLMLFDNPKRRIALFKILNDVQLVMGVIMAYPFKGFMEGEYLGYMQDYKDFVEKSGGTFETAIKGKPTLESLMEKIESLEKKLSAKGETSVEKEPPKEPPKKAK